MSNDSSSDPVAAPLDAIVIETRSPPARPVPPARWLEVLAAIALVVLADLTIYRGQGFAGWGAFLVAGSCLLWVGAHRSRLRFEVWLVGALLLLLAGRLLWQGSALLVGLGCAGLMAFAMVLAEQHPYVLSLLVFTAQVIRGGYERLLFYTQRLGATTSLGSMPRWVSFGLPAVVVVLFAAIFTAANPDVLSLVSRTAELWARSVQTWLAHFSLFEAGFWLLVLWLGLGLLRPAAEGVTATERRPAGSLAAAPAPLYAPFRNTLCAVIVLFAAYLAFEFSTLWFRPFPPGFYYAGYAHEGAAWLTLALAMATATLSLIFSGRMLHDPRLATLKKLAWAWSLLNFLLAIAVYHRLLIYIGFNGLTRLRIVGLLGITAVVIGFLLVVWKIARGRSFVWLVRRQLWTLAMMVYLYALLPIDALVVNFNVARIMAGDPQPAVQLVAQPISAEGTLLLLPLARHGDPRIRDGALALLARADEQIQSTMVRQRALGWTAWQMADEVVARRLAEQRFEWAPFVDNVKQDEAIKRFREYVYQWY